MTNTLSTRLNLTIYGDRTVDGPTMVIENANAAIVEALTTIGGMGPLSAIPSAGKGPRIYLATDTNALYFDNGSGWVVIGTFVLGTQTVKAGAGQSAPLQVYQDSSGNILAQVDIAGKFIGHFKDTYPWSSPAHGFQANWVNAPGYYYGFTQHLTGETAQVRAQLLRQPGALALLTQVDAPYIPLNTQRFPVWQSADAAWDHGSWSAVAALVGYRDAGGLTAGNLYIHPALGVIGTLADNATFDLNLVYTVGSPGITTP